MFLLIIGLFRNLGMRILVLIFLILPLDHVIAQNQKDTSSIEFVEFPEVEATYPGGFIELQKFLLSNIVYPNDFNDAYESKVHITFIVKSDGSIVNFDFKGINEECEKLNRNLFLKMPQWIPAEIHGKTVNSKVQIPIIINLK